MKFWKKLVPFAVAIGIMLPGLIVRLTVGEQLQHSAPLLAAVLYGLSVLGAAFILLWATEAAQRDVPQALALSAIALISVLPEYTVSFAFTYEAGSNPMYQEFALTNMIGANRTIVGLAWPLLVLLFALKFAKRPIKLGHEHRIEIGFLLVAGLYSLILPIKGRIDYFDLLFLVGLFIAYSLRLMKSKVEEPEMIGPSLLIGQLPRGWRITTVLGLIVLSGFAIFLVAEPFAHSLIETGKALGVDEVFLVQWFAPVASEAPEVVAGVIITWRGLASSGLGMLVSSKINQWTLLVGTLPLVFSLGAGYMRSLPLHGTFVEDGITKEFDLIGPMLVTSAQTLLATMIILNLSVRWKGAVVLFGLLIAQFFVPLKIGGLDTHYLFAGIYLILTLGIAIVERKHFVPTFKSMVSPRFVEREIEAERTPLQSKPTLQEVVSLR